MGGTLTHVDADGRAHMVDVGDKDVTHRVAVASARVRMLEATREAIFGGRAPKGDVLAAARLAGIMAAKRTPDLIPLCHGVALTHVGVDITEAPDGVAVVARAEARDRTGVEMEALVAVTAAALTVYDMCKAMDRAMVVTDVRLEEKDGGRSGRWVRG
jgi:cyclic pyranopterin phosphate synthase